MNTVLKEKIFEEEREFLDENGEELLHYSNLPESETAFKTLSKKQIYITIILAAMGVFGLIMNWQFALLGAIILLTFMYFVDSISNLVLVFRSLKTRREITFTNEKLAALKDEQLPEYTIFCPLYHEWAVLPQFISAIEKLDYPKEKLQVMLLLEEDDSQTIANARAKNLPKYFEITVVPHSMPKTKPKAMNFGLRHIRGEYIAVYDAEDIPEPSQLKKAVLAFRESSPEVVCIQSKLNFYNSDQNFLTKLFTAEYSLWFDLILPGLQSLNAPIPLGGTSNHFRAESLRNLGGWDAFNVTEDCDLGMRLAKRGYRTAIMDSTTYEEANSQVKNWFRQRSRWIKGYIQTYLVHMRTPHLFKRGIAEPHLFMFQIIVGGKIISMFINPLLWVMTILYFTFRAFFAPYIEPFFPSWLLYFGVFSLVFGNFLYLYYYMIGLARRKYDGLLRNAFLVPVYWLAMSLAALVALYEIVLKPHYWAKTIHGLHIAEGSRVLVKPEGSANA